MTTRRAGLAAVALGALLCACATSEDEPYRKKPGGYVDASPDTATGGSSATGGSAGTGGSSATGGSAGASDAAADGADDAAPDAAPDAGGPTAQLLLAVRTASSIVRAARTSGGSWATTVTAFTALGGPALAAVGDDAVMVVRAAGQGELHESRLAAGAWSALTPVGTDGWTVGAPALAAADDVVLAFIGTDFKHYLATTAILGPWSAFEPVLAGSLHSFGPSAPSVAALSSSLELAFAGDDGDLYTQTKTSVWQAAHGHGLATPLHKPFGPRIVARGGGSDETVAAFVDDATKRVYWTVGKGTTWTSPALVDAFITSESPVALAALGGGAVGLAFVAGDSRVRYARLSAGVLSALESPFPNTVASGEPALCQGLGPNEVEIAFLSSGSVVSSTRTTTWQTPLPVLGAGALALALTRVTVSSGP
ncbi:MAG: hypothetical protein KF718_09075 [Polyangiaceae bacterium]|nr:hypothetical protein [Polyangiaceae bacterium]